jgi:general secretion pathway protein C
MVVSIMYIYLPKTQYNTPIKNQYNIEYKKYYVYNSLTDTKTKMVKKEKKVIEKKDYKFISNILLKAIYSTSKYDGWIIILEKNSKKTKILSVGDKVKGYSLKSIYKKFVIFEKDKKEYKLQLSNISGKKQYTNHIIKNKIQNNIKKEIVKQDDNSFSLKRGLINSYIKRPTKIWKEISMKEVYKDGKIDGFKVNKLSKKSVFYQLGLKKNDVIKNVNNIELKSYGSAMKLYKKVGNMKNLKMIILRGDQEMELEYEIK